MNKYYAGIGSRKTPDDILELMQKIAGKLESDGWTLRSGGAEGADTAFAAGCTRKEIYLPWKGFNDLPDVAENIWTWTDKTRRTAEDALREVIGLPRLQNCSMGVRQLFLRNWRQIYGRDTTATPSRFVICWTPEGKPTGGTAIALLFAIQAGIPIFNLGVKETEERLRQYVLI